MSSPEEAVNAALRVWDKGERQRAALTFLRELTGDNVSSPRIIRWMPHLNLIAGTNRRQTFEEAIRDLADHGLN